MLGSRAALLSASKALQLVQLVSSPHIRRCSSATRQLPKLTTDQVLAEMNSLNDEMESLFGGVPQLAATEQRAEIGLQHEAPQAPAESRKVQQTREAVSEKRVLAAHGTGGEALSPVSSEGVCAPPPVVNVTYHIHHHTHHHHYYNGQSSSDS